MILAYDYVIKIQDEENNMNYKKLISIVLLLIGVFIIGKWITYNSPEDSLRIADTSNIRINEPEALKSTEKQLTNNLNVEKTSVKNPQINKKKSLNDDWCNAKEELSLDDFNYITAEYNDWQIHLGKARIKDDYFIGFNDDGLVLPNNEYVESYQELSVDKLEERAFEGDKWAMVAFLQKGTFNQRKKKTEIANRLLVQGASYYAINSLVINELVFAKANYRRNEQEKTVEHMVNVVAYIMLGLKDYNESGLNTYLAAMTQDEQFLGPLAPSLVLADSEDDIKARYLELKHSINQTREELGISVPRPPAGIKPLFNNHLVAVRYGSEDAVQFLNDMKITPEVDLELTPCIKSQLASLAEKIGDNDGG